LERALAGEEVREAFAASQAELEDQLRERELALLRKDSELRRQERTTLAIAAAALLLLALVGWGFFLSKRRILRRLDRALDELGKAQRSAARHGQELERALQEVGELQDDRLRAARLESIGLMAAGIAHDFNNLLTAFLGNVTLARESLRDRPGQRELLDRAVVAVDQASRLADQLLTLSKGGETRRELVDLAALVREAATFAASGSSAGLRLELADDLWPAEVDPGQISQVLGNLVLNALQATPEAGTVVVSARNLPAADGLPSERGDDPRVEIRVTDSGPGVPEELHERVFDPYFTTKSSGTGLGLTTAKAIVERHQGSVRLESGSEGGASFVVELPATPQHSSEEETSTAGRDLGQLRVLAVEDDPLVRRMYSSVFETIGVEAELAGSGAEALQLYRSAREAGRGFEVVLLDLSLPGGKDGAMVLEDLRRIDAGVRAVVTSGYTHAPEMVDYRRAGFAAALAKPFSIQGVKRALRAALHG